ncbi:uncharacterized protein LOC132062191, partial [Lycium ferocissimum]|uniref:uncharacterized protein LOC132062191 n=1 Tax=Lycium ferocissimum TaxID=112874 RepID=UPI002815494F
FSVIYRGFIFLCRHYPFHKLFPLCKSNCTSQCILQVFQKRLPPEAVDLICRFFKYSPYLRCTALEACIHPFFVELRDPNTRLPNGGPLPLLYNFKPQELTGIPTETSSASFQNMLEGRIYSWLYDPSGYFTFLPLSLSVPCDKLVFGHHPQVLVKCGCRSSSQRC